ncbi:MAG: DUF6491 family protein [Terracidiphilus sp.]
MRHALAALAIMSTLAVLAGCASRTSLQQSDKDLAARYAAYEGPPVKQFTWLGHFYSWEPLGRDQLVVFTTPSDAYFLKVWPNCDLDFAMNHRGGEDIGVTSTAGTVSAGLDAVIENSSAVGHLHCPISEIRKIDYRRMTVDKRAQAQSNKAAQGSSPAN